MKDSYFYKMISTQRWASYYTAKCFYSLGQWEKYFMLWPLKKYAILTSMCIAPNLEFEVQEAPSL